MARFPQVFTFSPWDNPGTVESQIVEFLKGQQLTKDKQTFRAEQGIVVANRRR
jgi:hypothetical protein